VTVFSIKKMVATKDDAHDAVNALQNDLVGVMTDINSLVASSMILLQNVTLTTTASPVLHNFGRLCRGFIVVDKTATFDVYRSASASNPDPNRFIMLLTSSGSQTVNLILF